MTKRTIEHQIIPIPDPVSNKLYSDHIDIIQPLLVKMREEMWKAGYEVILTTDHRDRAFEFRWVKRS